MAKTIPDTRPIADELAKLRAEENRLSAALRIIKRKIKQVLQ